MNKLTVDHVSFSYKDKHTEVLKDLHFEIGSGEFVCVLGQSGCGKSTLLRLLAGLEKPTKGAIRIDNIPISSTSIDRGVVFQDYGLFPWMTVGANLLLALKQRYPNDSRQQLKDRGVTLLEKVGLDAIVYNSLPKELSGGMQQRCAIAQALGLDGPIFLMDEPFGALDAVTRANLQDLIKQLWQSSSPQKTVIFVTHDVDEAILLANRIIIMGQKAGELVYNQKVKSDLAVTRQNQFEDSEILTLRNNLISHIHQDVNAQLSIK